MSKVPKELMKQLEFIEGIITSLNDLIDDKKINLDYYGKDFLEELSELRKKGLELKDELVVFKGKMEFAAKEQYGNNSNRFASTRRIIDRYLTRTNVE